LADLYDVAVMHDFFVDRLVRSRSFPRLFGVAESKAGVGGGSVHGIPQEDARGGNAVNLAHALARLGAKVLLITHSDAGHSNILREAFSGMRAEVRIKSLPPGLTLALEGKVNVMLSDSGGAGSFPPSLLTEDDWQALRRSRLVCSVNWAANMRGTELLLALRRRLGRRRMLFLNPSDVRDRFREYRGLMSTLKKRHVVDWVSLNEYEAASTAKALGKPESSPGRACIAIAKALKVRVDVHTERAVYTSSGAGLVSRRTDYVQPHRLTGAGDVWDAASIIGFQRGMDDERRLEFANAAAGLYVKADGPWPPTLDEVRRAQRKLLLEHS
jgi:sugar/nucleoside kinase (ribokinase family)